MAVTADDLRNAAQTIAAASSLRNAAALLRVAKPSLRIVVVDALDMKDETPALTLASCSVYLATSDGHCWNMTQDPALATALVLAQ